MFLAALTSLLAALFLVAGNAVGLFHGGAALYLWAAFAWLSSRRASRSVLRVAEFGVMTSDLIAGEYLLMLHTATRGELLAFQNVVDVTITGLILLMFAHATLIPNTWRAAIGPVELFLATPLLTVLVLYNLHPEVLRFAGERCVPVFGNRILVLGLLAAGLAVYGAHVLSTLHQEFFEARRLNQYRLRERLGDGGGLPRGTSPVAAALCGQAHPPRSGGRPTCARSPRARGPRHGEALAPEHRRDLRLRPDRRGHVQLCDGVPPGVEPGRAGRRSRADPPGRSVYLLRQACDGLAEAHEAGLVHRDVKPDNVFVSHTGTRADVVKLLDFGLVKDPSAGAGDPEGTVSGTPWYMAPEQAAADLALDRRCDIYLLGAVAYFMLTGRPPFEAEGAVRTMLAYRREAVIPPSAHRPGVPADLEAVVLRCLAKDPAHRLPDATSLKAALDACRSAGAWDSAQASLRQRQVTPKHTHDSTRP